MAVVELPPHGTRKRYAGSRTRPPCHCPACTEANAIYNRTYRNGGARAEIQHGSRSCYVKRGCRQPECVQANRDYQREYMRFNDFRPRKGDFDL